MPSKPRPKPWVAARAFKHAGRIYKVGDPVTLGRTIQLLSTRGDSWITREPKTAKKAETAANPADVLPAPEEG